MALEHGVLVVKQAGKDKSPRIHVRVGETVFNPSQGEVSQSLLDRIAEFDGKEVEFERVSGQPKQIRELRGSFITPRPQEHQLRPRDKRGSSGGAPHSRRPEQRQDRGERNVPQFQASFHNPYNFVPAPPRNISHGDLGDHPPVDQSTFLLDRYTGRIRVRMTVKTPLLVPDAESVQDSPNGHKTYSLLVRSDNRPLIPSSSVRGMLRSAYEAVTNSRFGRFSENHRQKLKYRQECRPYRKMDFDASPWDLLHESLKPATTLERLSPADRVFGWVKSDSPGGKYRNSTAASVAVRGLLRIGPVICESSVDDAVESFPRGGVPLAILSTAKPQQGRFYVAKSLEGDAQTDGLSKVKAGYTKDKGLRGRKVYPHHAGLPDGHWNEPTQDRTQEAQGSTAHYQEYRRPRKNGQEQRDDQNRSILGWVKPGAQFTFEVQLHNLSEVELGALLWLLKRPEDQFFRFGGGKPLGFGSVQLTIDSCNLRTGQDLLARYRGWHTPAAPADPCEAAIQSFEKALCEAYPPPGGGTFESIPFIAAFLAACRGFNDSLPIHYPRATEDGRPGPPSPEGESFKWFVANERGPKVALPDLAKDRGLPTLRNKPLE